MKENLLGIDVGGTKCAIIYGIKENDELHIIDKKKFDTTTVDETIDRILCATEKMMNGEFFSPSSLLMPSSLNLTNREIEILRLIQKGLLSKEIADKLCISIHTVNIHRQNLLRKLGVQNSIEAIRLGQETGLLS